MISDRAVYGVRPRWRDERSVEYSDVPLVASCYGRSAEPHWPGLEQLLPHGFQQGSAVDGVET